MSILMRRGGGWSLAKRLGNEDLPSVYAVFSVSDSEERQRIFRMGQCSGYWS